MSEQRECPFSKCVDAYCPPDPRIAELEAQLAEAVAKGMWASSHLQSWDGEMKPGNCTTTEFDRQTYRDHATAALSAASDAMEAQHGHG
ncbi:hypothetical protein [Blastomonas sp. CCH2-A2]|uniref:hypothetical protein n=1 Tax=Blastomonas sp. CCH2-A2 TaxID=1768788 RepID=UPI000A9071F9|nr:hypothetical protein [Blastomonas sp. CCH2-A2]